MSVDGTELHAAPGRRLAGLLLGLATGSWVALALLLLGLVLVGPLGEGDDEIGGGAFVRRS